MKKIILIILMLNLFIACESNDVKKDEKITKIVKSLEQRVGLLEKKVVMTKRSIEKKQNENKVFAEEMASLEEKDKEFKNNIGIFQLELENLEESIKKK